MVEEALSGEAGPGRLCRVCGAELPADSRRCGRCGAVHGEGYRCPHCRAIADVEPQGGGRQRCKACGGPRLLISDGRVALSSRSREALLRARTAARRSLIWRAAATGLAVGGAVSLLAAIALVALLTPGVMFGTLAFALASVPIMLSLGSLRRGNAYQRTREEALREAELSAASDIADASPTELTAGMLAEALGTDEQRAELLLAELSLEDVVERRVTDTGELAYSARPKLRVTEEAGEPLAEPEQAIKPREESST